ncbi:MAG: hypothetical protein ACLP9L_39215 [Thermoguttaceae bacterium]
MSNFKMLDVVIGVAFFFLFAGLNCSAVRELIESLLGARATMWRMCSTKYSTTRRP